MAPAFHLNYGQHTNSVYEYVACASLKRQRKTKTHPSPFQRSGTPTWFDPITASKTSRMIKDKTPWEALHAWSLKTTSRPGLTYSLIRWHRFQLRCFKFWISVQKFEFLQIFSTSIQMSVKTMTYRLSPKRLRISCYIGFFTIKTPVNILLWVLS